MQAKLFLGIMLAVAVAAMLHHEVTADWIIITIAVLGAFVIGFVLDFEE